MHAGHFLCGLIWALHTPQDASIKAFRPADTALRETGLANSAMQNGAALHPPPLALPEEAQPDARSAPEEGHCASVQALTLAGGQLCSAGGDATIRVWHPASLRLQRCTPCPSFPLSHLEKAIQ